MNGRMNGFAPASPPSLSDRVERPPLPQGMGYGGRRWTQTTGAEYGGREGRRSSADGPLFGGSPLTARHRWRLLLAMSSSAEPPSDVPVPISGRRQNNTQISVDDRAAGDDLSSIQEAKRIEKDLRHKALIH